MGIDEADPCWAHFAPVFEGSPDGLLLLEADTGVIVAANPALGRHLDILHSTWHGKRFYEVPVLKHVAADAAAFAALAGEVAARQRDVALKGPHGNNVFFTMRGHLYGAQGKRYLLLRFRPQVIDTRSSDNLLKSTWLARLVFENAPDGVSVRVATPDFGRKKLLACNQRYVEMAGYTEAQLLARDNIAELIRSLLRPDQDAEIERKMRALEPVRGVASWIRPDGRENAFEWHAVPMRVSDEIYILGIDRDITEERRTMERLRASQAEMDALISNIPDLVWFKDAQSRYITVNAAFLKATGKTMDDLRGKTDFDLSPPEIAAKYQADDARVVRDRTVLTVEERHELIGRPPAWIVTTKSPILDKEGNVLGSVGIARDITDRRRAEQENARQLERLEQILAHVPSEFLTPYKEDSVIGLAITKAIAKRGTAPTP